MIHGVLLAAGTARRFGGGKLSAVLPDGRTVAQAAAEAMRAALDRVVAVVRPDDTALAMTLQAAGCRLVLCERAAEGMGASLACGVAACTEASGWIIGLADMPAIEPATIARVATRLNSGALIAAPVYRGRRGHPVGFAARFGPVLTTLAGDVGARDVIQTNRAHLSLFDTIDGGVIADIDYPEDLDRLRTAVRRQS